MRGLTARASVPARPLLRPTLALVVALLVTLTNPPPAPTQAQPADCVQPAPAQAGCPLDFGQPVKVALAASGDVHTWRIRLTEPHGFHVTLSGLPADYDLHLFGPDGNPIAESTRYGTADELVAAPAAAPGEYELYVDSPLRQGSPAAYTLTAALNERISIANAARVDELAHRGLGYVSELAFSPNGEVIVVASSTGIDLYAASLGAGRPIESPSAVQSVAFSPDGQTLAGGSADNTVRLWRIADGAPLRSLNGDTSVSSVAFSPDGQTLASGSYDNTVRLWRVADGAPLRSLTGHTFRVQRVAFSPDGQTLASGSYDTAVRLWRVADGAPLRSLTGHASSVLSVAFSPDGQSLASGSDDSTVRLWRVADGTPLRSLTGHTNSVRSVAFSPDGQTLASGSDDGTVRLWGVR